MASLGKLAGPIGATLGAALMVKQVVDNRNRIINNSKEIGYRVAKTWENTGLMHRKREPFSTFEKHEVERFKQESQTKQFKSTETNTGTGHGSRKSGGGGSQPPKKPDKEPDDKDRNKTEEDVTNINSSNPLNDINYTEKVKIQMEQGDFHSFPKSADAFGSDAIKSEILGGDGLKRTKFEIPGEYMGKKGVFEYIIEPDGVICNHRLFLPK
ncbi:MAG: hypothetical protein Q4B84_03800 [Clostridia bacterium]|nr:hypothetical protein [Clostridia bacterium]